MTVTVAMSETALKHIGERLDALGLDIVVRAFDADGRLHFDGATKSPADVDVDYLWLTNALPGDMPFARAFEIALEFRSVDLLQTFNAGLDYPFYARIAARGVRICNSSAQAVAISEYVMAQVLSITHPVAAQRTLQAERTWKITPFRELSRTRWLILGFGHIGKAIAARVCPFGAPIDVVRRRAEPSDLCDRVGTMADLGRFLPEADVVVLACSLNDETRGFAGDGFFSAMREDSILVNIGRGGLIDDRALLAALDRGRPATAVLDVFTTEPLPADNPLWAHPRVRMTSHTSFAGSGVRGRWDALFLDNIRRYVKGETLINEVDPAAI